MENIKIDGSDERCTISGDGFSYTFINGHPVSVIKNGKEQEKIPFPEHNGKKMKSKTKLVHKYWDSALVITVYSHLLKKTVVKYHIMSDGEMKKEFVY